MATIDTSLRPFEPGTTGWSASDLDDREIERQWFKGRFEIIDGVLTSMAPAYFTAGQALFKIAVLCQQNLDARGIKGTFAMEAEIVIDESRVLRADAALMLTVDKRRQSKAAKGQQRDPDRTRLLVPPTLIIESVSPGHERHDRVTKLRWYAEFGVPNYWIVDAFEKRLNCFVLDETAYRQDAAGKGLQKVTPSVFPGLVIPLERIFGD